MRPTRLELEGFASFREPTVISFEDSELFVLTGATGSGKSSVIDAIVFALYGSVPRYEDRRLVAPVISQGKVEAKVRLDFEVDGTSYTAVRVVRRTSAGGATTKEARLENESGQVLAGTADELTSVVADRVIGLPFEHFTRCVVLPQGEFAEFLRSKPSDRQKLLVKLLALDLYGAIAQRARALGTEERNRAELLKQRLGKELAGATREAVEEAAARVQTLEALRKRIEKAKPELKELAEAAKQAERARGEAERLTGLLAAIEVPEGVTELSERFREARAAIEAAESAYQQAVSGREEAEERLDELPDRAGLEKVRDRRKERGEVAEALEEAREDLEKAVRRLASAGEAEEQAAAAVERVAGRLEALRREHSAADLARHLVAGEPCSVCLQTVEALPGHEVPADLGAAERAVNEADTSLKEAQDSRQERDRDRTKVAARMEGFGKTLGDLEDALKDAPEADEVEAKLKQVAEARTAFDRARKREQTSRGTHQKATKEFEACKIERSKAWKTFDAARDAVAELRPPAPDREALGETWRALASWAEEHKASHEDKAVEAVKTAEAKTKARATLIEELRSACAEADVDATNRDPAEACANALGKAGSEHDRLKADAETAERVTEERRAAERKAQVAQSLGQHLSARNFEAWLLNRALRRLVLGATAMLRELSSGAYSLALGDNNDFCVIDHHNADERRSAKTLSGGETFLASLSLALALAEHVAELATRGSARLDALFLDEGFGTLDPETLDTAATAIEELGAKGRMVGLVTHVRELAERMPVQYRVKKVGNVSRVERVVA